MGDVDGTYKTFFYPFYLAFRPAPHALVTLHRKAMMSRDASLAITFNQAKSSKKISDNKTDNLL